MLGLASIRIQCLNTLWFLRPSDPDAGPTLDTVISGEVILTLPSAKKVKKIDVELVGKQSMTIREAFEKYEVLHRSLTINPFEEFGTLQAGEHRFAWSFVVPANSAPHERLGVFRKETGEIPNIHLPAHGGIPVAKTVYKLRAVAHGCGAFGKDIEASEIVGLVNNSSPPGQAARDYNTAHEDSHHTLGPIRVHLYSRYFLISGLMRLAVSVPAPTRACQIEDVKLAIIQHVSLQSLQNPERKEEHKPLDLVLWSSRRQQEQEHERDRTSEPYSPTILRAGQPFNLVKQIRLANDNFLRQSTNPHSITGIRVSHSLEVTLWYAALEDENGRKIDHPRTKVMEYRFAARIASCDCSKENLELPGYSKTDPALNGASAAHEVWRVKNPRDCICSRLEKDHLEDVYGVDDATWNEQSRCGSPVWNERTNKWEPPQVPGGPPPAPTRPTRQASRMSEQHVEGSLGFMAYG